MAQTAVEWLEQELKRNRLVNDSTTSMNITKAKQMEREQHGDTWDEAIKAHEKRSNVIARSICDFDDYYAQTYGTRLQNETN